MKHILTIPVAVLLGLTLAHFTPAVHAMPEPQEMGMSDRDRIAAAVLPAIMARSHNGYASNVEEAFDIANLFVRHSKRPPKP